MSNLEIELQALKENLLEMMGLVSQQIELCKTATLTGELASAKEVLENEGLTLATDRLHYFSHWITPELLPIRYDVRFFVSEAPENQEPLHDGLELVEHRWIKPQDALHEYEHKNFNLVLPTIMTLRELCQFKTVEEVIRSTEGKNVPRILTKMVQKGDQSVEMMPDGSFWGPSPLKIG